MLNANVRRGLALVASLLLLTAPACLAWGSPLTWTQGKDGVKVYYPSTGWTWTEGRDGRRVVYPSTGWTWTESRNGRRVIYPSTGWTWTEGKDGQRIVYPSTGWTWTEGRDGQRVVYPSTGWTWTEGRDGRRVVYPSSGWSWWEDQSGRRIPCRTDGGPAIDLQEILIEMAVQQLPLTDDLRPCTNLLLQQMNWITLYVPFNSDLGKAHALLNIGSIREAREEFRRLAHSGQPDEVRREAGYFTGYCSARLGEMRQAISDFEEFWSRFKDSWNTALVPDAMYMLGILHEHVSELPRAFEWYRACIQRFPGSEFAQRSRERLTAHGERAAKVLRTVDRECPTAKSARPAAPFQLGNPFFGQVWNRFRPAR